jgi:hypothetical protein
MYDHYSKLKLPREKDPSPTHHANHTYGGAKNKLALYRIFFLLSTWKKGFANLYYKGFEIIFRTEILQLVALNIAQLTCEAQVRSVVRVL